MKQKSQKTNKKVDGGGIQAGSLRGPRALEPTEGHRAVLIYRIGDGLIKTGASDYQTQPCRRPHTGCAVALGLPGALLLDTLCPHACSLPGGMERAPCPLLARVHSRQHLARSSSEPRRKDGAEQCIRVRMPKPLLLMLAPLPEIPYWGWLCPDEQDLPWAASQHQGQDGWLLQGPVQGFKEDIHSPIFCPFLL